MLHAFVPTADGETDACEDLGNLLAGHARRDAIEPRRVRKVLLRRHLLEEGRLDRHSVDEPLNRALFLDDVVAEDGRRPAVRQEQRRQDADQRRLARAVLAQDGDALTPLDPERDALERRDTPSLAAQAGAVRIAARELLAQVVDLNSEHDVLLLLDGTRTKALYRK